MRCKMTRHLESFVKRRDGVKSGHDRHKPSYIAHLRSCYEK